MYRHDSIRSLIKSPIRAALWRILNEYRFKDSFIYEIYLNIFFAQHMASLRRERKFFAALILKAGGETVFDIGANGGDKTAVFVRYARRIVCVEPSPGAVDVLRQRFKRNPKVVIVPKGVAAMEGSADLYVFRATDGVNTFSNAWAETIELGDERDQRPVVTKVKTSMTTLDKLVDEYGIPSYIKIDVEGYEIHAVAGLSLSVPLVSFECNLPQFKEESVQIVTALTSRDPYCTFNYCVTEPPARFEFDSWLNASSIITVILSGRHPFMEIFCRSGASAAR